MNFNLCALLASGALTVSISGQQARTPTSCDTTREHTLYSWNATEDPDVLRSPDREKVLTVERLPPAGGDEGSIRYTLVVGGRRFSTRLLGFGAEVSWSPDSSAFAVTETEGGGGFDIRAYVFRIGESGLQRTDLFPPVAKAFGSPAKCEVPVAPNVGFISWLDSRRVLVAAEVVPVSICKCSGMFAAYEVGLPDASIIRRYSQAEAKKKFWSLLGCELRDANDGCASEIQRRR